MKHSLKHEFYCWSWSPVAWIKQKVRKQSCNSVMHVSLNSLTFGNDSYFCSHCLVFFYAKIFCIEWKHWVNDVNHLWKKCLHRKKWLYSSKNHFMNVIFITPFLLLNFRILYRFGFCVSIKTHIYDKLILKCQFKHTGPILLFATLLKNFKEER